MTELEDANKYPGDLYISENIRDAIADGKKNKDDIIEYVDEENDKIFTSNNDYLQHLNTLIDEEFKHEKEYNHQKQIKHQKIKVDSPINIQEGYDTHSIDSYSNCTNSKKPSLSRAMSFQFSTDAISFKPMLSRALSLPQSSIMYDEIDEEEELQTERSLLYKAKSVSYTKQGSTDMDDQKSVDIVTTPLSAPPFLAPARQLSTDVLQQRDEMDPNDEQENPTIGKRSNKYKDMKSTCYKQLLSELRDDKSGCVSCIPTKLLTKKVTINSNKINVKSVNPQTNNYEPIESPNAGLNAASKCLTQQQSKAGNCVYINGHAEINTCDGINTSDQKEEKPFQQRNIISPPKKTKIEKLQEEMRNILGEKTAPDFAKEAGDEKCCENVDAKIDKLEQLKNNCHCLRRIEIVLKVHFELIHLKDKEKSIWKDMSTSEVIQVMGQYEQQQLFDDFSHLALIHINADNDANRSREYDEYKGCRWYNIGWKLCDYFQSSLRCDVEKCKAFSNHHRDKINEEKDFEEFCITEDITFQQECDKIHSYFLHSTIKFGRESCQTIATEAEENREIDKLYKRFIKQRPLFNRHSINPNITDDLPVMDTPLSIINEHDNVLENKIKQCFYVGKKEDDLWWQGINEKNDAQTQDEMYNTLARNMGVFRWQNPHGFGTGQNRETAHLKPMFNNIKEEALFNDFEPLSKDNWNQTLRKSKIFFTSFSSRKIRTKRAWYFHDQVSEHKEEWKADQEISIQEIVTLKLYTDFDKLQFALKKCFRFETLDDILNNNETDDNKESENLKQEYEKTKTNLENRLRNFFHWRGGLLLVLNKFGTKLNHNTNMVLYHGVNGKMIIKPSQTYAFNGPLSTTVSYHVARTFATAKGMVLKITSQFPRLNYCNAFDASLLSDYPEEQEWLVGFLYVRLLEVRTRKLLDSCDNLFEDIVKKIPLASWVRQEFFTIHLFNEQIFSMSERLERILAQFLKANRYECCKGNEIYSEQHKEFDDWNMEHMVKKICAICHHGDGMKCNVVEDFGKNSKEDVERRQKIFPLLVNKFNDFRMKPNFKQRVKFDMISNYLKRFFMERGDDKDIVTDERKWVISFNEITTVYPKIKEIHFVNQYIFDDILLKKLITQINKHDNTIKKVVFLYYNYKDANENDNNKPLNFKIFKDPDKLNSNLKKQLEDLGWKIKHNKNGQTGYKIRVYYEKK